MRHYVLSITTKGPVHIGNGEVIGKKDYFKVKGRNERTLSVLDARKFVGSLSDEQLGRYCAFLESDSRSGLQDLLEKDHELKKLAQSAVAYSLSVSLTKNRGGRYQYLEARACVKDAEGRPYLPGSSIKGMLRTALLATIILKNPKAYQPILNKALEGGYDVRVALPRAEHEIERRAFWTEVPNPERPHDRNDLMRYVSIADSEPLDPSCLVFAKKYDKFSIKDDGRHKHDMGRLSDDSYWEGNDLNIYRECIKPGVTLKVPLDIDERIDSLLGFKLDADMLQTVLKISHELYKECLLRSFELPEEGAETGEGACSASGDGMCHYIYKSGPLAGSRCRNQAVGDTGYCNTHQDQVKSAAPDSEPVPCYIGGGVGYDSKTVINALLRGDRRRVETIAHILYEQFPSKVDPQHHYQLMAEIRNNGFTPKQMRATYKRNGRLNRAKDDHRHWEDPELGVSPHTLKLGKIGNKQYQMGLCDLRIEARQ